MDALKPLVIRVDASAEIGTGHVMRMIALAQAWQDRGGETTLAACQCPEGLKGRLEEENVVLHCLEGISPGGLEDALRTIQIAKEIGSEWIVTDGYHFGIDYQRRIKKSEFKLLVVDDHGYSDKWAADAILNQNIYAQNHTYHNEISNARILRGLHFSLLRREFRLNCPAFVRTKKSEPIIEKLLITLGGADPDNVTGKALQCLNAINQHILHIKVLIGAANPHWDELGQLAASSQHKIELLRDVRDMPSLYQWADGIISAGGSTCWEWMYYGLPAAVFNIADNQSEISKRLAIEGLCIYINDTLKDCQKTTIGKIEKFLQNPKGSSNDQGGRSRVDGKGAPRVAINNLSEQSLVAP